MPLVINGLGGRHTDRQPDTHILMRKPNQFQETRRAQPKKDAISGIFLVKEKYKEHNINLAAPSCSCKDWAYHHMPCKHFFAMFRFKENWQWNNLSTDYLNSPFLSTDTTAITKKLQLEQPSKAHFEMSFQMLYVTNNAVSTTSNVEERDNLHDESNADITIWETLPSKVCSTV